MAVLTTKSRNALPDSAFMGPGRTYPGEDAEHARDALSRVSHNGSPALKARIRREVHRRFPGIHQSVVGKIHTMMGQRKRK